MLVESLLLIITIYFIAWLTGFLVLPSFFGRAKLLSLVVRINKLETTYRDAWGRDFTNFLISCRLSPNLITLFGLFLVLLLALGLAWHWEVWLIFIIALTASLTDALDGMVARASNRVTVAGGFLDGFRDIILFLIILWGASINSWLNVAWVLWFTVGIFLVEFMKLVELLSRGSQDGFLVALGQRGRGQHKLSIDRVKFFFFLASCLLIILTQFTTPSLAVVAEIFFTLTFVIMIFSVIIHGAFFRYGSKITFKDYENLRYT